MANTIVDTKNSEENQESNLGEIEEMYRAGVHFGYSRSARHPKMKPYFLSLRNNVEVFDLEKVLPLLEKALGFLKELGAGGKKVLFVATKPGARDAIEKAGRELNMPYVTERWLGGTLTNFEVFKKRIADYKVMKEKKMSKDYGGLSKKDIVKLEKDFLKLQAKFEGLEQLTEMPAALLIVDPKQEKTAVEESQKKNIPVVAILNSDCDPESVAYPIPANDVSVSSVQFLVDKMVEAYRQGQKEVVK